MRFFSVAAAPSPLGLRVARVLWRDEEIVVQQGQGRTAGVVIVGARSSESRFPEPLLGSEGEEMLLELLDELDGTTYDGRLVALYQLKPSDEGSVPEDGSGEMRVIRLTRWTKEGGIRERRVARWTFMRWRRLRSTAMWVILWLSASSALFEADAGRWRFLFLRSLEPATAGDLMGPVAAAVAGSSRWTIPLVSDSDTWVTQLSSCSTAQDRSISAIRSCLKWHWLCIRRSSWKLVSCG